MAQTHPRRHDEPGTQLAIAVLIRDKPSWRNNGCCVLLSFCFVGMVVIDYSMNELVSVDDNTSIPTRRT